MSGERCSNSFCQGPEKCLLNEAVDRPNNLQDLTDHWHVLADKCPRAKSLEPAYQQKIEELSGSESKP